jgi:alkylhydroperoxidase/carboxymuconolactone decarboxylase family protein YurZ
VLLAVFWPSLGRARGVRLHSERALTLGASPREVLEAIEVAAIPGGMPGLWLSVETLQEIPRARDQQFEREGFTAAA